MKSSRPRARIRAIPRADFTPALIGRLHELANRLMAESEAHFRVHAATNDVVHVFEREDTEEVVGFQFWKSVPLGLPGARAIFGGKLRIVPEFRGRALHLSSGLRFFAEHKLRHPTTRTYRRHSLASLFGFTSITSALANYELFDPRPKSEEALAVASAFREMAASSHYRIDEASGLFDVAIRMTPETLARYPARFFDKPAARAYAAINPGYRTNGCYVGFWFRFSPRNLLSLARSIQRARRQI